MSGPSPAKPWELQRGASEIGASSSLVGRRVPIGSTSGSISQFAANPAASASDTAKDATKKAKKDKADKTDKPEKVSAPAPSTATVNSGAGAPGYGVNGQTTVGGYGAGMMGPRPYGGMGYGGSSMYGGGYNSGYGGYGGGYGMGGGYGGYSGYSGYGGYGGGYGGGFMGGGYMGMPPMGGGAWLQNFHSTVGSIGMITELLGMNAEALHHVVNGMLHFFERIGAGVGDLVAFITGAPQLDASGQPLPPEESRAVRKAKIMKWAIGFGVVFLSVLLAKKVFAKFSLGDSLGVTRPAAESAWNTAAFGAGLGAGVTNALTQRQLPYYPHAPGQFGVDPLTGSPYPPSVGIPAANYAAPTPIPASQLAVVGAPAVSSASAGPVAPSVPSVPQSAPQTSENNGVSDHAPPTKPE